MSLFLLFLAGFPPTAGISLGKFTVFSAAISQGYIWLVWYWPLAQRVVVSIFPRYHENVYGDAGTAALRRETVLGAVNCGRGHNLYWCFPDYLSTAFGEPGSSD